YVFTERGGQGLGAGADHVRTHSYAAAGAAPANRVTGSRPLLQVRSQTESLALPGMWKPWLWTGTVWRSCWKFTCARSLQGVLARSGRQAGFDHARGDSRRVLLCLR